MILHLESPSTALWIPIFIVIIGILVTELSTLTFAGSLLLLLPLQFASSSLLYDKIDLVQHIN